MTDIDKNPLEVEEVNVPNSSVVGTKDKEVMRKPEKLRLICNKCGKEWIEKRPDGYYVRYKKGNVFLVNRRSPYDKKLFRCPKCRSQKNIGRLPIEKKIPKT